MIAACLLTCDRPALTEKCASSFVRHNGERSDLALLHCDGGSSSPQNSYIAERYGFRTLLAPAERVGQMETLCVFVLEAATLKAEWVLWLENDWVSDYPLPPSEFFDDAAASGVETIRLFGKHKMAEGGPRSLTGQHRMGTKERIEWTPADIFDGSVRTIALPADGAGCHWEQGCAHWAAGGSLIRTDILVRFAWVDRIKDFQLAANLLLSLRPTMNIMWSIGHETTPGFRA